MAHNSAILYTESVSATTATNSVSLGSRRWENGHEYVYIYNGGTTATINYGMIVSAFSAYTVVVSSSLGDRCAGVAYNAAIPTNYYGWLCTKGVVSVTNGANAAGSCPAILGGGIALHTNGVFTGVIVTAGTICTGQTGLGGQCGIALTAMAASETGKAYLNQCVL